MRTYRVILESGLAGKSNGTASISERGALLIWAAYEKAWGRSQTMERRENRGGIAWEGEISELIERKLLPKDFQWRDYEVNF